MRAFSVATAAFCLVCIGVHAAADRVDNLLMAGIERIDIAVDAAVSRWAFSRPLVDWIDSAFIVTISRSVALAWELATSLLLVASVFTTERRTPFALGEAVRDLTRTLRTRGVRSVAHGLRMLPLAVRPLCTCAFVMAGSGAVGRSVYGTVMFGSLHGLGPRAASILGRSLGCVALLATFVVLGLPAIAASAAKARHAATRPPRPAVNWRSEIAVLTLVVPLAWFALKAGLQIGGLFS